jgi:hypothetical protein
MMASEEIIELHDCNSINVCASFHDLKLTVALSISKDDPSLARTSTERKE